MNNYTHCNFDISVKYFNKTSNQSLKMLSTSSVNNILEKVTTSGHTLSGGFNVANLGELQRQQPSLDEIVAQKKELESCTTHLPTFFKLQEFITCEPNFSSNELVVKKIFKHLETHGINNFFDSESLSKIMHTLSSHDLAALCELYGCSRYSQVVDVMLPSFYDIVFVVEDTFHMDQQYISACVNIIANTMFATLLYDSTGVYIRTLNTTQSADELKTVSDIQLFMSGLAKHSTSESLGEQMYDKVYETVVKPTIGELAKPVLLVVLSNSVPTKKDEVLESLERCKSESNNKMFLTFVNVNSNPDVARYYAELNGNPHVTLVSVLTNIGMLVRG